MSEAIQLAADALELIEEFGHPVTLRRASRSVAGNAWETAVATTDYAVYVQEWGFATHQVDGTRVQVGDTRFLLSAAGLAVVPTPDLDRIVNGNTIWDLVYVEQLPVQGGQTLYILHVRK